MAKFIAVSNERNCRGMDAATPTPRIAANASRGIGALPMNRRIPLCNAMVPTTASMMLITGGDSSNADNSSQVMELSADHVAQHMTALRDDFAQYEPLAQIAANTVCNMEISRNPSCVAVSIGKNTGSNVFLKGK